MECYHICAPNSSDHAANALFQVKVSCNGGAEDEKLRPFWRGRMNLTKEEQVQMFEDPRSLQETSAEDESSADEGSNQETSSSSSSSDDGKWISRSADSVLSQASLVQ